MAVKYPDILEHNNPDLALVDSSMVRGGRLAVTDRTALYALTSKVDQLKEQVTIVFIASENKDVKLIDITKIGQSEGWEEVTVDMSGKADIDGSNINKADWETALGVSETDTVSTIVKRNSQGNIVGKYLAMTSTVIDQQTNIGSIVGKYDNGDNTLREFSAATIKNFLGLSAELAAYQALSQKNQPNGYAGLDANGLIISSLLPSYVDDVLEFADFASLPASGETGKIYITTDNNKSYRWSGSIYTEIVASPGSTDSVPEGSLNLYYTDSRVKAYADTLYLPVGGTAVDSYGWGGYSNGFGDAISSSTIDAIVGQYNNGRFYRFSQSAVRTFLGMPSTGETLQSVTDRDNTTTKRINTVMPDGQYVGFWSNNGGANNEYLGLYATPDDYYLTSNANGTGSIKNLHIGVGGNDQGSGSYLTILNNGNVGIGTVNPLQNFVVSNGGALGLEVYFDPANEIVGLQSYDRVLSDYKALRLDAVSIGIGMNPVYKFDVSGAVRASGRFLASAGLSLDGTDTDNWIIKKNGTVVEFWLAGVLSMKLDSTGLKLKTGLQFYPDNF